MLNQGKHKILENYICACDYEYVLFKTKQAIKNKRSLLISPIASQTLAIAKKDIQVKKALDKFDLLVPDSHWVMKSLNWIHKTRLKERLYGPDLMLKTCALSEKKKWKIYLYGTNIDTLIKLKNKLLNLYPELLIVKIDPSKYRDLTKKELIDLQNNIKRGGTQIVFIAIGSPKQELLSVQLANTNKGLNKVVIPVGAAFDFISGVKRQAPKWMQNTGFEWLFRLLFEPKRLWKRYLYCSALFFLGVINQSHSH